MDDELATVRAGVAAARAALLRAVSGRAWACPNCGAARQHEGAWTATLLCEAAGVDGPNAMTAFFQLVSEGVLVLDERMRVRVAATFRENGDTDG